MILGDFHIHSKFSDGKGTLEQNYEAGLKKGLKQIGFTEHGLKHIAFGLKERILPEYRAQVDKLNQKGDIQVFLGIEANIINSNGDIDLVPKHYGYFDFIAAGYHKTVLNKSVVDFFRYNAQGLVKKKYTNTQIQRFTKAYLTLITCGKVDFITHLFYGLPVNTYEVAKAAADYGVYLELNGKKVSIPDEDLQILIDNKNVKFIINSDAHTPERVGDFSVPMAVVDRLNIDKDRIVNYDKTLRFNRR